MNQINSLRIGNLTDEASEEMHKAMLKSLKSINEFFDAPYAARKNLTQEIKVSNSVINSFAKIRQAESGKEMVMLQMGKMLSENKKEFKDFIFENLPYLIKVKKLKS